MRGTRRQSFAVGLLVCLPVLLLGVLPALAWQLTDGQGLRPDSVGRPNANAPRVARGMPVRITATVRKFLTPGIASPIQLQFMNPNAQPVTLHRVVIRITRIDAPQADLAHPCTRKDFRIRQMPNRVMPLPDHNRLTDLTALRVPVRGWPRIKLRNRPGNQDGCKSARLTLAFRAYERPRT